MHSSLSPDSLVTSLLDRFLEMGGPKRVEKYRPAKDWLSTPGAFPRFTAPTLFLGIQGTQELSLEEGLCRVGPGDAVFVDSGVSTEAYALRGKGAWLGLRMNSRPFTVYGQDTDSQVFAAAMSRVEGWPHFRQLRRVYELLSQPDVSAERGDGELIRLLIHQVLSTAEVYPWHGGILQGSEQELTSPHVVGASSLELGALFVDRILRRGEVAKGLGISESYLATVFKDHLNTNLTEYLLIRRMTHADWLLMGGKVPVADIAKLCGFKTSNYFIRAFRGLRGSTPLQIRKLARKPNLSPKEASRLFYYENFQSMAPIPEDEAHAASHSMQPFASRPLMVANSGGEPISYEWEHAPGEYFQYAVVPPLNVNLFWHPAPAVWRVRSGNRVIGHFISERQPCQILV